MGLVTGIQRWPVYRGVYSADIQTNYLIKYWFRPLLPKPIETHRTTHLPTSTSPSSQGVGKPLWLILCLKFTTRLRDLPDNCMCWVQRWGSHSNIMLINTIIAHRVSPLNLCDLLSKCVVLNLFRLAITNGWNTYWHTLETRVICQVSFLYCYVCPQ